MLIYEDRSQDEVIVKFDGYDYEVDDFELLEVGWDDFKESFNEVIEKFPVNMYLITGSAGLWSGNHNVADAQFIKIDDLQDILDELSNHDLSGIKANIKNNGNITYQYSHHDGINYYEFVNLDNIPEKQLKMYLEVDEATILDYKENFSEDDYVQNKETFIEAIEYFYL